MSDYISPQKLILKKIEKILNDKGRFVLNQPEARIIYLLVEIRKILEKDNIKNDFPFLNLFCNWALHTRIDKSDQATNILQKVANSMIYNKKNIYPLVESIEKHTFVKLRKDLRKFCKTYFIPASILAHDKDWYSFLNRLIFILVDSTLELKIHKKQARPKIKKIWNQELKSIEIIIKPPNNEKLSRKADYRYEIPWPFWKISFTNKTAIVLPCKFRTLKNHSEPNLSGGMVGFTWKTGNLC